MYNFYYDRPETRLPQILAEDAGAAELRNPVFVVRTGYSHSKFQMWRDRMHRRAEAASAAYETFGMQKKFV